MRLFLFIFFILTNSHLLAQTQIRLIPGQSEKDSRHIYPHKILKLAMEASVETHGKYEIQYAQDHFTRDRALIEVASGKLANVHYAPTKPEWEKTLIPIRIPIRKGLLGYRLFLVHKDKLPQLAQADSIKQLKRLSAGLGAQWSITKVMTSLGFKVATGNNYEGLFVMLNNGRFDYFPRGVNEIFKEYDSRSASFPNMMIEPDHALFINIPTYFFVSPNHPAIAERIEVGLKEIIDTGVFEEAFTQEFGAFIEKANLKNRQVFYAENELLSKETPLEVEKYWFKP